MAGLCEGGNEPSGSLKGRSVQMCSYNQAEVRWSAIMLEPHFSEYHNGYLLHEQRKRVLKEFQDRIMRQAGAALGWVVGRPVL
ncbi:hypothetical protein ANN_11570 [Periplaneta americana]|uniref:Uncharacterized protein n=1 Tax=Periplaneta americana TaxID=6978 RepID=A0ABQ8T774_PERAM|nr:hypothetical protein ANN_11570 [Periplaneta americana]